ncbi:MAG TPA: hypothetical protein VER55_12045 [Ardenticatenaceae bacterium]|nr:hypothetical protein [Ardenticatenaceae bacterium]
MILGRVRRLVWLALLALVLVSVASALAAANSVPPSALGERRNGITANDLKPAECAALNLSVVVQGTSTSSSNSLVLGTGSANTIRAGGGQDCVLGGGGNDSLDGDQGNDVLLGGPGDDTLTGGSGTDVCYGGPGLDIFLPSCETQVQ